MFLIKILPDFIFYGLALIGILGFITAFFIPFYKNTLQVICSMLIAFSFYYMGCIAEQKEWEHKLVQAQADLQIAQAKADDANKQLAEKLSKSDMQIHATMKANLNRMNQLAEKLNKQCIVPQEVITLINNSARNIGDTK